MDEPEVIEDKSQYIPKAKKPMSEAQLAALAKARQKAYELRQQKKNVVNIDSSSEEEKEDEIEPAKPEPKAKPRQRKSKPKPPVRKEEPMKEDKSEASDDESCCMTAAAAPPSPPKSCLRKCTHRNIYLYYED